MNDWNNLKVIDTCLVTDYVANGSFKSLSENVQYSKEKKYAILLRTTDFTNNFKKQFVYVGEDSFKFLKKSSLIPNDIIICNVGSVGLTFLVPDLKIPMTLGPNAILVRPLNSKLIDNFFLFYLFTSSVGQNLIKTITSGTTQSKFNKTNFRQLEIPIPSIIEQKRIVKKLDEGLEKINKAIENTKKNIENTKELFDSKLDEVFSQESDKWLKKSLKSLTIKIGSGATPRGGQSSYKESGISLIRSMNVYDDGFRNRKLAFIDEKQAFRLKNVTIEPNDILLNISGASVARCCIVPEEYLPARVNQHVSIIRLNQEVLPKFIHYSLISNKNKKLLLGIGEKGGSTRQAITKSQIELFQVRFPTDVYKQEEIINKLDKLSDYTKKLESTYNQKLLDLEELKKSILVKAFKGEL